MHTILSTMLMLSIVFTILCFENRRNCSQMTDTGCRRLLYLSLVRSHLSYANEIRAPQASSRDLAILEGVQRRATKFILQNYELSYLERLRKLNLLPISYWLEIKDLIFFFQMQTRPLRPIYFLFCHLFF